MRALAEGVRALDSAFATGGTVDLDQAVVLRFQDGPRIEARDDEGWGRSGVGKRLMKRCQPAPFGVGSDTRYDDRVRNGGQLLAAGGALRVEGLDLAAAGISTEIQRTLCPGDDQPPIAELYALNVYLRGGHFVGHKDTPRDPEVFGTLVVCLPVRFRGGRLVVRGETTRSFDWESPYSYGLGARERAKTQVQWAAFYGDVDHEVETVTDGSRVTLTYLLRRVHDGPLTRARAADTDTALADALSEALRDRAFMPRGGTLGVPCLHLYAETPGLARPAAALSGLTLARLKGRDRLVALAARRLGLEVRYRPYLYDAGGSGNWRLSRAPTPREVTVFERRRVGQSALEQAMPIERAFGWREDDDVTWILPPPWRWRDRGRRVDADPASELLGEVEYSATDYFGNEGSDGAFYVSAALLFDVPRKDERRLGDARPVAGPRARPREGRRAAVAAATPPHRPPNRTEEEIEARAREFALELTALVRRAALDAVRRALETGSPGEGERRARRR